MREIRRFWSVMVFDSGIATDCNKSIVEIRARQRRKVPVPDALPLKYIGNMPVATPGLPTFLPRLFLDLFSPHTLLYWTISPTLLTGKGEGLWIQLIYLAPELQSWTKSENGSPVGKYFDSHPPSPESGRFWTFSTGFLISHSNFCLYCRILR